jgi:hypothetical protein
MSPPPRRTRGAKVEGRGRDEEAGDPMAKFRALTRRLLRVRRDELPRKDESANIKLGPRK